MGAYSQWTHEQLIQRIETLEADRGDSPDEHAFTAGILETLNALIVVLDREGRIVRFNSACERLTGYRFAEVCGERIWDVLIAEEEVGQVQRVFEQVLVGNYSHQYENVWMARSGERRLVAWSKNGLTNSEGKVTHVIASGIDITDNRRLEQEILEISEAEKRRFSHDLHDGLGQHLAGIRYMSQVLQKRLTAKGQPEETMVAEVNRLVDQAMIEARRLARGLAPVVIDEKGLMTALDQLARYIADVYQIQCKLHCPNPVLVEDNTVSTHLYRIAQEAIQNAIYHGRADRIEITLHRRRDGVELSVEDNGIGMGASSESTGMGLKIMRYRANIIGGALVLRPGATCGLVVVCTIPMHLGQVQSKSDHDQEERHTQETPREPG